ncbi:hypothetical protein [Clostridium butyricum]
MEELRKEYSEDIIIYGNILERFKRLNETDPASAFKLSIDASVAYDRWSEIKLNKKKSLGRGEKAALKDRLKEMCEFLQDASTMSRMVWKNARDDLRSNRGD